MIKIYASHSKQKFKSLQTTTAQHKISHLFNSGKSLDSNWFILSSQSQGL